MMLGTRGAIHGDVRPPTVAGDTQGGTQQETVTHRVTRGDTTARG